MAEQREEKLRRQIASLRMRNEQEQEGRGEHVAQPLSRQPFSEEIDEARIPPHFREILVDPFDGTQDPHAHLQAFQTHMYISGGDDKLSYKLFPGTLRGVALQWIMNLPPRSIYAFNDLADMFLSQFAANKPKRLEVANMFGIKQAGRESLKNYMTWFNDATVRVNDPDQKFFVKAFQKGLRVGPFSDALALQKPMSMEEIRVKAEKHIEVEESRFDKRGAKHIDRDRQGSSRPRPTRQQPRPRPPRRQEYGMRQEVLTKFTPLKEKKGHIMREICHTQLLNFPQAAGGKQLGKNRREWCDFHRAVGHSTKECWTLGAQLEEMVQQGKLGQYGKSRIKQRRTEGRTKESGNSGRSRSPRPVGYRGTISTISGEAQIGNRDRQREEKACQSYQILTEANLTPLGERRRERTIVFGEKDRKHEVAGDEPMVISVVAEDFKIERVPIDQGSSANILYGSTFRKMGLSNLKETSGCLYGFSGEKVPIKEVVEIETIFSEGSNAKMILIVYTMIEVEASYNIIMGRSALNRLRAIVSTYHLCMKYPTAGGVGTVWADSSVAKRCYQDSLRIGQWRSAVNALSLEIDPRYGHEERKRPHPVEKLKEVQVGPSERQRTKISTTMTKEQEAELVCCLQQNNDVFAWAPEDMPRIDPKFMNHRLSIADGARPVMQKKRKQGEEKRGACHKPNQFVSLSPD
ncbi:hypothetical protein CR513_42646, partial [Mucuna pruriens]